MSTGRIEGDRRDATPGSIIQPTQRELAQVKPSETTSVTSLRPPSYRDFEVLVEVASQRAAATAPRSPQDCIADFVMPRISDPALFLGGRSIALLESLVSNIIPNLDENEELRSLARALITDEIERQRKMQMRLQSGIAL